MIEEIRKYIEEEAIKFGVKPDDKSRYYIERNNTKADALNDNGGYFGFIHPEEEHTGQFYDFSLTIFPTLNGKPWVVCLGIGSLGFKNDYELASFPGVRRIFSQIINEEGFCKSSFLDIESNLPKQFIEKVPYLKNSLKQYTKVLPVCQIVSDPLSIEGKEMISSFVAGYAMIRDWASNKNQRDAINKVLSKRNLTRVSSEVEIERLLIERKYIIIQGPPGTGKTRISKIIAKKLKAKVFFTQFHAETSYSDFIYGIRPDLNANELKYKEFKGIFLDAIEYSLKHENEKVILIIDELNRANLSNILGPIFYLFEYQMNDNDVEIDIGGGFKISKIPDNLCVICTMNTADRSLAVVDFALRRRFAWYDLKPQTITDKTFFEKDFLRFNQIFFWYADSEELNLQPGQGYFIAGNENIMQNRIRYELYPLVKEYLMEGLLTKAKEEFNKYFVDRINKPLYE